MLELPAEYFRAQSQLYSWISETALQSLMTHKPASDKSDAFSQARISVSTVIRMTPTDQSTSQEPNRVLQDTLNSFKTHFVTDFLPGNISTMETLSLAHSISEPKSKLTLFLFLFVCLFCCCFETGRVSLSSPGCPGTLYVDQAGLKLIDPPASAPQCGIKSVHQLAWPQFSL